MPRKTIVIAGHITLDNVASFSGVWQAGATMTGRLGVAGAWPRAGGAPLFAARRGAMAGHDACPLTWIGDDPEGAAFMQACAQQGISIGAVDCQVGARTPRCLLIYDEAGSVTCLLDPGDAALRLSSPQMAVLERADHICISAGPAELGHTILDHCPADVPLSWIVKLDEKSFPGDLCARLAARAQFIFCNTSERAFVNASFAGHCRPDQVIIQTMGAQGVQIDWADRSLSLPADPVDIVDATGAGDTFAGEVIACLSSGDLGVVDAVRCGMVAARKLLQARG